MTHRAVFIGSGTKGDIHPFVRLAIEFKKTGCASVVAANEYFKDFVEDAGIEFHQTSSRDAYMKAHCSPYDEGSLDMLKHLAEEYHVKNSQFQKKYLIEQWEAHGNSLVVFAHSKNDSIAKLCQKKGINFVAIHLFPTSIQGVLPWPYRELGLIGKTCYRIIEAFEIGKIKSSPIRGTLVNFYRSLKKHPESILEIALFPKWFGLEDKHDSLMHVGFPLYDGSKTSYGENNEGLESFIREHERIILFACGSGVYTDEHFYQESFEIAQNLGVAAIFVNPNFDMIRKFRSPSVYITEYIDYSNVFREIDLVVHHGGIGTCAQAIAAGIPQVIRPLAYDQPDNGWRISMLGLGGIVTPSNYTKIGEVSDYIGKMLDDAELKRKVISYQSIIKQDFESGTRAVINHFQTAGVVTAQNELVG